MRIRERALQRVVLRRERSRKLLQRRPQRLDAAGVVSGQRLASVDDLNRRSFFRAGFGEKQRAVRKRKRREQYLAAEADFLTGLAPSQSSGDHQMNHQKEVRVELEDDAFSQARRPVHLPSLELADRRRNRSQDE